MMTLAFPTKDKPHGYSPVPWITGNWLHYHRMFSSFKCLIIFHFNQGPSWETIHQCISRIGIFPARLALVLTPGETELFWLQISESNWELSCPVDSEVHFPTSCAWHFLGGNETSPPPTSCLEPNDGGHGACGKSSRNAHGVVGAWVQMQAHFWGPAVCGQVDSLLMNWFHRV